ncbi:MAG TPA: cupin domain-containing protein [Chloroflexota bacterium]|nr:cupin domain-containing protein [Chloroflexota bacterium]
MAATQAPAPFQVAKVRPPLVARGKISNQLARAGMLNIGVQVIAPDGGETNLHAHPGVDSAWMVLAGKAVFYTTGDAVVAELDRNDVITIPAGTPYWFKAGSDENLVILHMTVRNPDIKGTPRIDYAPPIEKPREIIPGAFFEG